MFEPRSIVRLYYLFLIEASTWGLFDGMNQRIEKINKNKSVLRNENVKNVFNHLNGRINRMIRFILFGKKI